MSARLHKSGSETARRLLAAGRAERSPANLQRAVLSALSLPPRPSPWSTFAHSTVSKIAVGVMAGALAVHALDRTREMPPPSVATPTVVAPLPSPPLVMQPIVTPHAPAPRVPAAHVTSVPPPTSLAAELRAIAEVRHALSEGDGAEALDDLDLYETTYPHGAFAEEASALRVHALRALGDAPRAARALEDLRTRFPDSLHLAPLDR